MTKVYAPVGAVRWQRLNPRVPSSDLEEGYERLVELGKVRRRGLVEVCYPND